MTASFDPEIAAGAGADFHVFGVDEVGRGPLAGPVVAAAVHIPMMHWTDPEVAQLQDSKTVSAVQRRHLAAWIRDRCIWALAEISAQEIDQTNILAASLAAMAAALSQVEADVALIDGHILPPINLPAKALIRGDAASRSIAAASILAKEYRDALMTRLHAQFPVYGWDRNAGYPTPAHRAAILAHGATCYHRATFRGVKNATA